MSESHLKEKLTELHDELKQTTELDDESRTLIYQLIDDIDKLLEPAHPSSGHEFRDRIEDMARRFESSHPAMAGVIQKLGDVLAQSGI